MLIRDGNARVLANPKIATLNGREASMLIGSRIPFTVTGVVSGGGAGAGVATQKALDGEVGIKLRIPDINPAAHHDISNGGQLGDGFTGESTTCRRGTRQARRRCVQGRQLAHHRRLLREEKTTTSRRCRSGARFGLGALF